MKQILFLVFTAAILSVSAQTEGELIDARPVRVMIVPYHPNYYLSDADQELAEINEKKPDELSRIFRYGLDFSMQVQVQQQFEAYSFLRIRQRWRMLNCAACIPVSPTNTRSL